MSERTYSTQQAIVLAGVEPDTLKGWLRHNHVECGGTRSAREFTFAQVLKVSVMAVLTGRFKVLATAASSIADLALSDYLGSFDYTVDVADVNADRSAHAVGDRKLIELQRDEDGSLRHQREGDDLEKGVGVVLPLRLISRLLMASMKALAENAPIGSGQ